MLINYKMTNTFLIHQTRFVSNKRSVFFAILKDIIEEKSPKYKNYLLNFFPNNSILFIHLQLTSVFRIASTIYILNIQISQHRPLVSFHRTWNGFRHKPKRMVYVNLSCRAFSCRTEIKVDGISFTRFSRCAWDFSSMVSIVSTRREF